MIKAVIIDDTVTARKRLANKLHSDYPYVEIVGEAANAADGASTVNQTQPDIVFLDVELPDISGLSLLRERLANLDCKVIIYTAHQKYAVEAFRSFAFDFLQKPIDDSDLQTVMKRVMENDNTTGVRDNGNKAHDGLLDLLPPDYNSPTLSLSDVCFFRYSSSQRRWEAITNTAVITLKSNVFTSEIIALGGPFVQLSRNYIINKDFLQEIKGGQCKFFPPFSSITEVTVGRGYKDAVKKLLKNF